MTFRNACTRSFLGRWSRLDFEAGDISFRGGMIEAGGKYIGGEGEVTSDRRVGGSSRRRTGN